MANKKITELQLRTNVDSDVNFPIDDTIQTYRVTSVQVRKFVSAKPIATKTANYALTDDDGLIFADSSAGGFQLTLPNAVNFTGRSFHLKKISDDENIISVISAGGTIDGETEQQVIAAQTALEFISNGTNWFVL